MVPVVVSLLALAQPPGPDLPPPGPPPINLSHPAPPLLPPATAAGPVSPPDAKWAEAGMPCPGPAAHPFQRLPRVCLLKACECDGGGTAALGRAWWVKEFHDAAHVPLPRFTIDGQAVCHDGLLIYEGMRVTVYKTGVYDVSFTAEVPEMPVTLRLQLVFQRPAENLKHPRGEYRLTLPPFRLEPKTDARPGDPAANIFHVAHRGFSSVLVEDLPAQQMVQPGWQVTRVGTARFGTPVAITDPNR
jgi:hypothetical protein